MPSPHPHPPARGPWPGIFVVFEGGDGSGKSTQARALYNRLRRLNLDVKLLAEPGGTPLGRHIRALVTGQGGLRLTPQSHLLTAALDERLLSQDIQLPPAPEAELMLFAASRAQLVRDVIKPSLERGCIVLCDRYAPSTLAYQGYGRGLSKARIRRVNDLATLGIWPDLVLLLDIPVEQGRARQALRKGRADRFEREGLAFQRRVRRGYLAQAARDPDRWTVLLATRTRQETERAVWERVVQLLLQRRPQLAPLLRQGDAPAAPRPTSARRRAAPSGPRLDL